VSSDDRRVIRAAVEAEAEAGLCSRGRGKRRVFTAKSLPKRESTTWMEGSGTVERVRVISNKRSGGE
jgi:hypothetical protein